ncbi:hypothetical protein [Neptunicella sp.]|uniref:hypothetical protein n=1 Tax=Neptunicella sp. TaxID=2125986 RepID=UPI003F68F1FC
MKSLLITITIIFSLIVSTGLSAAATELPKQLNISYVQHRAVMNVYQPLIAKAYEKLGIKVHFTKVDIERSLALLNNGELDGDVLRAGIVTSKNSNLIAVEPSLNQMEVVLYCRYSLPCNKEAMQSTHYILGLVGSLKQHHQFLHDAKIRITSFVDYQQMKQLFELGRLDYMININDLNTPYNHAIKISHKSLKLFQLNGYHLIHKKWASILPQLSQAIIEAKQEILSTQTLPSSPQQIGMENGQKQSTI